MENNKSTEEIRHPRYQNISGDNQSETTLSFPSSISQDDLERYFPTFFENEDFQRLGVPLIKQNQPPTHWNKKDLDHEDCFYSEIDTMKTEINILAHYSYKGSLKEAFQEFQKMEGEFLKLLSQFGKDKADLCLRVGWICYRGHVDVEALKWLNKAREFSEKFKENKRPDHFRKLYLCLADVSMKNKKWEDAEKYLNKAEKIIEDYFPEDPSRDGRSNLSWVQALRGHLFSRAGRYEEAEKEYKSQIDLKKTLGGRLEALAYDYLADFYISHGEKDKAKPALEEALKASRRFGDGYYAEARLLRNRARILFLEKDEEGSKELYIKAFETLKRELPDGNTLEWQYKEEYRERFGVEYKGEEGGKEESWQAVTNSV